MNRQLIMSITILILLCHYDGVQALDCGEPVPVLKEFASADIVFRGTVIDIEKLSPYVDTSGATNFAETKAAFHVKKLFKGPEVDQVTLRLSNAYYEHWVDEVGDEHLIFGYVDQDDYTVVGGLAVPARHMRAE